MNLPYNFDLAVSARISSSVAEEIVRRVVEEQTGKTVDVIEAKIRAVSRGAGPSASTEYMFDGFFVTFKNETVVGKKPTLNKDFIPATYS